MTFTIPNIVFVSFLAIATGYLTFLTTKGGLTDNRFSKPWEKLTKRGKLVLAILVFMGLLFIGQEWNSQVTNNRKEAEMKKESKTKDSILNKERDQRDSTITNGVKLGVDSNSKKLYDDISKAFAKQELRLDTVRKDVQRIRDSAKGITNNYNQPDPVILIDSNGIYLREKKDRSINYGIAFRSYDAGSTNYDIICYLLTEHPDGKYDVSKLNFFPKKLRIPKNGKWATGFGSNIIDAKNIYIYLKGKYTTLDETKVYYIDDLYNYDPDIRHVDILLNPFRNKIIQIIQSVPENKFIP